MSEHTIGSIEELRAIYREPSVRVQGKKADHIDEVTRRFLETTPFFLFATSDASGSCDVSPRGGPSGQIIVLDEAHLAFPDLNGNNLVDSLINIIENPHAGLLVLTPGKDETLRLDGKASISTDPDLLGRWDGLLRTPKCAVVIEVESLFLHCAKSFRRGGVWDPESWDRFDDLPDSAAMFNEHSGLDTDVADQRSYLESAYVEGLAADLPT